MNVSVIIPTHNRISGLIEAVSSVLNQTVLPKEIIVIDDASDDNTETALENIESKGVEIQFYRFNKSQGACSARNKGAELATCPILMFLDDDDTWEKKKIEEQIKVFRENPKIGLVYSGKIVVYDSDRSKTLYKIIPEAQGKLYPQIFHKNLIGTTSSVAIKKTLFEEVGGFDINLTALQDYDLWIRCTKITMVGHDSSCNVRYTISSKPSTQISGNTEKNLKAIEYIMQKYKPELENMGFIRKKKIKSSFYFYIARVTAKTNYLNSIKWIMKSIVSFPNLKAMLLIFPSSILNMARVIVKR